MDVSRGSDAEIPMPVLADVDEPIPPAVDLGKRSSHSIPAISVTKPPVPRPVVLPTVSDIVESSPRSDSFGEDLEAGRGPGLPPSTADPPFASSSKSKLASPLSRRPPQPPGIHPVSHRVVEPLAEVMSPTADATTPLVRAMSYPPTDAPQLQNESEPAPKTDLLADSVRPSLEVEPSSSLASQAAPVVIDEQVLVESPKLVDAESAETGADREEEGKPEEKVEETTIRLIGSGGLSDRSQSEDSEPVLVASAAEVEKQKDLDVVSIKSMDSLASVKKQPSPPHHKKAKSGISGLRRFSGFGLKKKGSVGSVKSIQEGHQ